jgi:YVTN family beta-propeller protein
MRSLLLLTTASLLGSSLALAQHAQTSAVAVDPNNPKVVWATNRDNDSVARIDVASGVTTNEVTVGVRPRTVALSLDGTRAYVANMRGNVPVDVNFVTPFTGSEIRGSLSVIDTASKTVIQTLTDVGVEPYGVAVAPNGKYLAVSAIRSGTIRFYSLPSLTFITQYAYPNATELIQPPLTIADVDSDRDGVADLGEPRGFVIRSDSAKLYVTHTRSGFVSALNVALSPAGLPTAVTLAAKIDTDLYPFHTYYNPTPVQEVRSQGVPRFLEDVALSPDGARALVPHVLLNVNHDVNFDFSTIFAGFPGAFANRTYPALSVIDAAADSFSPGNDASLRLENQLSDPLRPAAYVPFGKAKSLFGSLVLVGGSGSPDIGGTLTIVTEGVPAGYSAQVVVGTRTEQPAGSAGTIYAQPRFVYALPPSGVFVRSIPDDVVSLEGKHQAIQIRVYDLSNNLVALSNGVEAYLSAGQRGVNKMGQRAGHPARVLYSPDGTAALMLNRGSEDVFLYDVNGGNFQLHDVFPPRHGFVPRAALDTTTPTGDLPLGMALASDPSTGNNDSLLYIINEMTRTLSVLRVDWTTRTILQEHAQIPTVLGADKFDLSERMGEELFEDASRGQTTGAPGTIGEFNNSCYSCHFEGGEDANVWQRGNGPRSTMPFYDGTMLTGLILWKGVRLNMGETGPMFGGENGGDGLLTDAEQQALVDAHERIPVPLNPNLDPVTGGLTPLAALGQDLFFGTNDTGLNPPPPNGSPRSAGCAECHPRQDAVTLAPRAFTTDQIDPILSGGENLGWFDPFCQALAQNFVKTNIRNVNSGVDIDNDGDGFPDPDRNLDGFIDLETYAVMNTDKNDDFSRDDPNSYNCPSDPSNPLSRPKVFARAMRDFSVPTKLGVFSSGPYFHDHCASSLRMVVDPAAQETNPTYGSPAFPALPPYPGTRKMYNEFHDVRGHEDFVQGASKVQINLQSTNKDADIEAILAFIRSL